MREAVPAGGSEKEFAVLEEIARDVDVSQRQIARSARVSLGMVNLIVKTLVRKGYVKVSRLNKKKVRYILTPKGMTEKTRKAYLSLQKTLALVRFLKSRVQEIAARHGDGGRGIALAGAGEIRDIAELALREADRPCRRIVGADEGRPGELVLVCSRAAASGHAVRGALLVDLVAEMARLGPVSGARPGEGGGRVG